MNETIKLLGYRGSVEICDGFTINLVKMPKEEYQDNMNRVFGWKFTTFKESNHSQTKKDNSDSSNENYLETRNLAGEDSKSEQMPVDNKSLNKVDTQFDDLYLENILADLSFIEARMDLTNGNLGTPDCLCIYCRANEYDGKVGVKHKDTCPIIIARDRIFLLKERIRCF